MFNEFEWDPDKAGSNVVKYGVSFTEAETVFLDPFSVTLADGRHYPEPGWITIGISNHQR